MLTIIRRLTEIRGFGGSVAVMSRIAPSSHNSTVNSRTVRQIPVTSSTEPGVALQICRELWFTDARDSNHAETFRACGASRRSGLRLVSFESHRCRSHASLALGGSRTRWDSNRSQTITLASLGRCDWQGSNPIEVRFAPRVRSSQNTDAMGFEPTTVGLEVRRSVQTELRALDSSSTGNRHKR